ncbi:6-bladed beta-propeller [Parabacteroides sp. OttesenSCG-928-J18]|nr:6-bladed beta-propeller [Parabacteroides sp. OttesenSCG-928-J18]
MVSTTIKRVFFFIFCTLLIGCVIEKGEKDVISIDISKDYSAKEIDLREIADVSYVRFERSNESLFGGFVACITDQTIVIYSHRTYDYLFFTYDGKLKSKFNRRGNGPEEYIAATSAVYDEAKNELFVLDASKKKLFVYSSVGECKRVFSLPSDASLGVLFDCDENSLLLYDSAKNNFRIRNIQAEAKGSEKVESIGNSFEHPFCRISKQNGHVMEYILVPENFDITLGVIESSIGIVPARKNNIINYRDGFLLYHQETDTMFYYRKDQPLEPVFARSPSMSDQQQTYLNTLFEGGCYEFIQTISLQLPFKFNQLVRDKRDGSIYQQKIVFDEFQDEIAFTPSVITTTRNAQVGVLQYDVVTLKDALDEGKLNGRLKEIVQDMDEEENDLLFLLRFKD